MIKRLSLLAFLSMSASAEVTVLTDGTLQTDACVYGRGSAAIASAKAQASAELARFIKGHKSLAIDTASQSMAADMDKQTAELYEKQRSVMLEGLSMGAIPLSASTPMLSGNDTCITVALDPADVGQPQEYDWEQGSQNVSVTVSGEGWPKNGQSARQNAEMDALQRAISQVVGVWLTQQHAQSSKMTMTITDDSESTQMQELIGQQLVSHSEGLIKEWQTLDSQPLSKNGIQVTIHAVVEKAPLIQQVSHLLNAIGSPRVQVIAPEPLKTELLTWLGEQGIEVGATASLTILANADVVEIGNNRRLHLNIDVRDLAGNIYGHWKNNPALLALPSGKRVRQALMEVHLADDEQTSELKETLQTAFTQIVARGGLVRKIVIPQTKITQPEKLQAVLSTLGGVSDVAIHAENSNIVASLRYKGNTGELADAVHQALSTMTDNALPAIVIENDFTLRY